jgi:hypothetical protein
MQKQDEVKIALYKNTKRADENGMELASIEEEVIVIGKRTLERTGKLKLNGEANQTFHLT